MSFYSKKKNRFAKCKPSLIKTRDTLLVPWDPPDKCKLFFQQQNMLTHLVVW